ncbi:MAG: hypothetical protein AAF203_01270 [Pseudomonadota bacterium]
MTLLKLVIKITFLFILGMNSALATPKGKTKISQSYLRFKAYKHLKANGYGNGWVKMVQKTKSSFLFVDEDAVADPDHPCSAYVVVDKKTGNFVDRDADDEIRISTLYADVTYDATTKIIKVCAD